ncbi:MAG TPA: spermidine/putrescine ABC transporter substrate-binding protein [Firmicutes bacterium]|jgi:spermidine/putrescine transport system substrate-binding protein|nr:spermidine/putrescine ABC transporter substrate-binding protein [Bacillota bacterium]
MNKKRVFGLLVPLMLLVLTLSGCSRNKETLYVYNWGDYIDESVLGEFEKETGIKVVYDTFATNEDMYVKIKSGGSQYDLIFPSDYMITRMRDEGMLEKINLANIPNFKYIDDRFKGQDYDPKNEYSVPYMWGTVGILYNTTMVDDPVDSWDILWNPKYSKQIIMLDSQREAIGVALLRLGYSINTTDVDQLNEAAELLKQQKPLVLAYALDEAKDKMVAGEAALALVWSGEALYAMDENPDLDYAIPDEGTNLWFDGMAIPKGAKNKEAAEKFIDFLCRTEIAFRNADYTGYATPHTEARKLLDPEILNNKAAYPDEEDLMNAEVFVSLGEVLRDYDRIWTEVKAY